MISMICSGSGGSGGKSGGGAEEKDEAVVHRFERTFDMFGVLDVNLLLKFTSHIYEITNTMKLTCKKRFPKGFNRCHRDFFCLFFCLAIFFCWFFARDQLD